MTRQSRLQTLVLSCQVHEWQQYRLRTNVLDTVYDQANGTSLSLATTVSDRQQVNNMTIIRTPICCSTTSTNHRDHQNHKSLSNLCPILPYVVQHN